MLTDIELPNDDRDGAIVAGTILLLRDALNGPEVLLLKRNPQAKNMGDVWMFPGGKVEDGDAAPREVEQAANAAVRELHEEAAIVLSTSELICFSHWLTPAGMARRFATWFYVARLPENAAVVVDGEEKNAHEDHEDRQNALEQHIRPVALTDDVPLNNHRLHLLFEALVRLARTPDDLFLFPVLLSA